MPEVLFRVEGLSRVFPDGTAALSGVNLEIREGEFTLVAGANGSGKTLLMRMLVALAEPTAGRILYKDIDVRKATARVRTEVGLVFQDADAQIVGETVEEDVAFGPRNLKYPVSEIASRVDSALRAVGLSDKRDASPRRLSGGEKRRLAVAGVLAMGCGTVIMDEPFANLDWPGVEQVLRVIMDLKDSGKTVIVLTHELEKTLSHADRLVILHKGCVRDDGSPEEVLGRGVAAYGVRDPRQSYRTIGDCTWLE